MTFRPRYFISILAVVLVGVGVKLLAQQANVLEQRFDRYDSNHDGLLSGAELDSAPLLKRLDLNSDGTVSKTEALQAFVQLRKGAKSGKASGESGSGETNKTGPVFQKLDANHDDKLSREELKNEDIFAKLDVNKDNGVTLEEALKVIGEVIPENWMKRGATEADSSVAIDEKSLQEQPHLLKGDEFGVGHRVQNFTVKDTQGHSLQLSSLAAQGKGVVVAMFGATCPISGKLGPELARIEKEYTARGVSFVFVSSVAGEESTDIAKFISTHAMTSPAVADEKSALALALGATTTTEVFLIDAAQTLVYRGAVNDQYGLGYAKDKATQSYLRDALTAMLAGQAPLVAATSAPGCALDLPAVDRSKVVATKATYHNEISRILQSHCVECHRADGLAPFSLESHADVLKHAGMMKKQITRGAMPPWFAARTEGEKFSPWANDCSLSELDKSLLLAWLDSDRPVGDVKDAPVARVWPAEWSIGKPDMIVQLPRAVSIKAEGTMPYQMLTAETTLTEDKWVKAYEILPTDRTVVHHVIVTVHERGAKGARDNDEGAGGYWAAYVPGNSKQIYPSGFARNLPAGSVVSFQIHYTPNGKATQDQLRMGLVFATETPRFQVVTSSVPKRKLNIPAGEANHVEVIEQVIPFDMNAMAFMAHMHVRGKAFKFELQRQGESNFETLLDLPHYDFNWQLRYDLATPRVLHRGDKLRCTAVFDNSAGNAANPDPSQTVHWGPQTSDEMMIGYVEHFKPVVAGNVALSVKP